MSAGCAGRVIVGIDCAPQGLAALRAAVGEAALRGMPLHAVRIEELWPEASGGQIDTAFNEALGGIPEGLTIERSVQPPPVAGTLAEYADRPEDLLVIGSSCHGWWHTLWSGSVARACVRKARCRLLVVPAPPLARELRGHRRFQPQRDVWRRFERETRETAVGRR